jgi:predicted porin
MSGSRKKLSLAAALLVLPSAARAGDLPLSVHLYGFLDAEIEWARAIGGTTPYTSRMRVADGNSRLGLFGSYQLTPSTEIDVQLEGFLNNFEQGGINDLGQSATLESRNTYIGVVDKRFGTLLAGNFDNAYRSLVGTGNSFGGNFGLTELGLDLWNNTTAAMSGGFASLFGRGEARLANSVHYRSPDIFGVRIAASYGFDEAEAQGGRRDHLSAAALYSAYGFKLGVGFDHQANTGVDAGALLLGQGMQVTAVNDVATNFYKAIISYQAPTGTYVGFGYERSVYGVSYFTQPTFTSITTPLTLSTMSQGGAMASAAQAIGDLTVMISFGKLGPLGYSIVGSAADYQATQISLGAKYAFDKSFMAYCYFTRIDNNPLQNLNLGAPIYSNNLGTSTAFLAPGDKPTAGGVGMIARF